MTTNTTTLEKSDHSLPKGCIGCAAIPLLAILLILGYYAVQLSLRYNEVQAQRSIWLEHAINEYELVISDLSGGSYTLAFAQDELKESPYEVNALFDLTYRCVVLCEVDYHPQYGFPDRIDGFALSDETGLFDSISIQIIEINVLD